MNDKTMPELPTPFSRVYTGGMVQTSHLVYTADQMHAYVLADRCARGGGAVGVAVAQFVKRPYGEGIDWLGDKPEHGAFLYTTPPLASVGDGEAALARIVAFLQSDSIAITFQSLAQYRTAALAARQGKGDGNG